MYKSLIIILFLVLFSTVKASAQQPLDLASADSITYQYYLAGNWDKLITAGNEAINQHIDFKWLRQRMGYAYFMKFDYFASLKQYQKALTFDENDVNTRTYLYYCGLNTSNLTFANFQASKLSQEAQQNLGIKPLKIMDVLDFEYNYKLNNINTRTNPNYWRLGINSQLGYRLNLYQAVSDYTQTISSLTLNQFEYFVLADYAINPHLELDIAYHYLNTKTDTATYKGNMIFARLSSRINRLDLGLSGSVLDYDNENFGQIGIHAGLTLPGQYNVYIKSSLYQMLAANNNRIVYSQSIGALFFKKFWTEGNITLGNLKNYIDANGLYIYNSVDATTFRTGLSIFWYVGKKITLFGNYTYDYKQTESTNNITTKYNQHSISSGIIWKL
jgi:hypothetical protein